MIIDSSALVALVRDEHRADAIATALAEAAESCMSAGNALEAAIVIDARREPVASRRLNEIRREVGIAIAPVTAAHVEIARQAYRDYGKGSGHPAQLNFGDCFAYALASDRREPLLCVGDDFRHTDLELVELVQ